MRIGAGKSFAAIVIGAALVLVACGPSGAPEGPGRGSNGETGALSGEILIDGSSTVYPLTELMAYEFGRQYPDVRVTVGVSGTGGGFERWVRGETAINNASRPIKDEEREQAQANGIEPIELAVAFDGLSVVVNRNNDWVECLTVEQLHEIWREGSTIQRWSDLDPFWPNEPILKYGPGTDSGTFDYFNEVIIENVDDTASHTTDYTASEDDNVLVQGVAGSPYAIGYFGYAYYVENQDKLRAVAVDGGSGCVEPSEATINDGSYSPLSRPLFIYVSSQAIQRPEVAAFARFYLEQAPELAARVGYVPLPADEYQQGLAKLDEFAR